MDAQTFTTLISSVGFPITACVFLGYYINSTMKEFTKVMQENTLLLREIQSIIKNER